MSTPSEKPEKKKPDKLPSWFEGKKKPAKEGHYNSIVVRTGIGFRWKPTLILVTLWLISITVPLILGGVPLTFIATDLLTWTIPILVLFVTYVVRNTLKEFDGIFGLFERKDSEPKIKQIFRPKYDYEIYREKKVLDTVLQPFDVVFGAGGIILLVLAIHPWTWQMVPFGGLDYRGYVNEFTAVRAWIALSWSLVEIFFIGATAALILAMINTVIKIGESEPLIAIERYSSSIGDIEGRQKSEEKPEDDLGKFPVSFLVFHRSMREIGGFMYRFCVKLIIMGLVGVWVVIAYDMLFTPAGGVSLRGVLVSFMVMLAVFALFVIPQMNIHKYITQFKGAVLQELSIAYEKMELELLRSVSDKKYPGNGSGWKNKSEIVDHSTALDRMISHVRSMGDWSFSFPGVLKLLGAAAVPLLTAILQLIASGVLGQLIPV